MCFYRNRTSLGWIWDPSQIKLNPSAPDRTFRCRTPRPSDPNRPSWGHFRPKPSLLILVRMLKLARGPRPQRPAVPKGAIKGEPTWTILSWVYTTLDYPALRSGISSQPHPGGWSRYDEQQEQGTKNGWKRQFVAHSLFCCVRRSSWC